MIAGLATLSSTAVPAAGKGYVLASQITWRI